MSLAERNAMDWALGTGFAGRAIANVSRRTLLERLGAAFLAAFILLVAAYSWVRPDYNWDMVAYVATALEDRVSDPVALHAETWREIEAAQPRPAQLYEIQKGNDYNLHQWQNPVDFESQLSMYRVKVLYIAALRALEPFVGMVNATVLLSVLPLLGIGALSLVWLGRAGAMQGAFLLPSVLVIADLAHMSTAVTPDMLVCAVSLFAIYWLAKSKDALACAALLLSVFIRPDNLILVFALAITAFAFGWRKLPLLLTFVASFLACAWMAKLGHHPGWWAHFYFSCVEIQNSMVGFHPDFSLAAFAKGYLRGLSVSLLNNDWPALYVVLLGAWALLYRAGKMAGGRENALMFGLAIGTLGKFASFPLPDDRFYFVFIAGMALILLARWKPRFDLSWTHLQAIAARA